MLDHRLTRLVCGVIIATLIFSVPLAPDVPAQSKKLKIGVVYDYTGPFAGGGSELHALGAKIMIVLHQEGRRRGTRSKRYADAQSKPTSPSTKRCGWWSRKVDAAGFYCRPNAFRPPRASSSSRSSRGSPPASPRPCWKAAT
jgi:hypothetical protein